VCLGRWVTDAAAGDEAAFVRLLDSCDAPLRRLAAALTGDASAEQLVAEAWRAALQRAGAAGALDDQAARTWLCRIVVELARARGAVIDARLSGAPCVGAERFVAGHDRWTGHWRRPPVPWGSDANSRTAQVVARNAIARLPSAGARAVTVLRDVDGVDLADIAQILGISEADARYLLHRGRAAVREALEQALASA
jgi:RNA polymerase sigma-70 factor (ECF subfamily)